MKAISEAMEEVTVDLTEDQAKRINDIRTAIEGGELGAPARLPLFSVFDKTAQTWSMPVPRENPLLYLRDVRGGAAAPNSLLGMFPDDFEVFEVGHFEPVTGSVFVAAVGQRRSLATVRELLAKES